MNVQDQFNLIAKEYDENRRKFIPCFEIIMFRRRTLRKKCLPLQKSGLKMFRT